MPTETYVATASVIEYDGANVQEIIDLIESLNSEPAPKTKLEGGVLYVRMDVYSEDWAVVEVGQVLLIHRGMFEIWPSMAVLQTRYAKLPAAPA